MRILVGIIVLLGSLVQAASWRLPVVVDTGFFERTDALASVSIDFPISVKSCRGSLHSAEGGDSVAIPFWFEPSGAGAGVLSWVLQGDVDSLLKLPLVLRVEAAESALSSAGNEAVRVAVLASQNTIPNGGFEVMTGEPPKVTSTWKGTRAPDGWGLVDFGYRHRQLPDLKSSCRVTEEKTHEGERALKFVSEINTDTFVCGAANGPRFSLKPGTRYELSYYVFIESVTKGGYVSSSVNFMNDSGTRLHPKNYAINRIQCAYGTTRNPEEDYLGKWVHVSVVKTSLPEATQGQIVVGTSLTGVFFVDDFRLREIEDGPPVNVEIGTWEKEDN